MEGRGKSVNWNKVASMGLDMQLGALKINSAVTRGAGNETKSLGLDGTHTEGMDRHVQVANRAWSGTHSGSTRAGEYRGRPPAQCTWRYTRVAELGESQFAEYGRTRRDLAHAEPFFAPFSFNFLDISRVCTYHTLQTGARDG